MVPHPLLSAGGIVLIIGEGAVYYRAPNSSRVEQQVILNNSYIYKILLGFDPTQIHAPELYQA